MKKLKMIVTSVIVLAIIGGTFAFNAKKCAVFCIDSNTTTGGIDDCDQTIAGGFIDPSSLTVRYYYTNWDGKASTCTAADNNKCPAAATATIRLSSNNCAQ